MSILTEVKNLRFANKMGETITIAHVEQPHGEHSDPVIRIGTSYHHEKNSSIVEIPYQNLEELIEALYASKKVYDTYIHERFHDELISDTGGGQ